MARIIQVLVVVLLAATISAMIPTSTRATAEETTTGGPRICNAQTVCGWTVYDLNTKRADYFVRNDYCDCAENQECLYYDDDISIGAYVNRCQLPPSNATSTTSTTEASST